MQLTVLMYYTASSQMANIHHVFFLFPGGGFCSWNGCAAPATVATPPVAPPPSKGWLEPRDSP